MPRKSDYSQKKYNIKSNAKYSKNDELLFFSLQDSLKLFNSVCNNRWFESSAMILFLNKTDIFAEKIVSRPIHTCFPDYKGSDTFSETSVFVQKKFESLNQKRSKDVYTHFTCATDSNNIKFVFDVVSDLFVLENLKSCKLY